MIGEANLSLTFPVRIHMFFPHGKYRGVPCSTPHLEVRVCQLTYFLVLVITAMFIHWTMSTNLIKEKFFVSRMRGSLSETFSVLSTTNQLLGEELQFQTGVAWTAVWTEEVEVPLLVSKRSWRILHLSYSQSDVAFGCSWVMSRASLFSVPVPQGHCPLRENSVYHCFWQPCSQPDAVGLGGPWNRQRWLIPPQWLIEELQGEAIYNQTFQVQCSSIFSRRRGTGMGMAHKTSQIQINLTPVLPFVPKPFAHLSECSGPAVRFCW